MITLLPHLVLWSEEYVFVMCWRFPETSIYRQLSSGAWSVSSTCSPIYDSSDAMMIPWEVSKYLPGYNVWDSGICVAASVDKYKYHSNESKCWKISSPLQAISKITRARKYISTNLLFHFDYQCIAAIGLACLLQVGVFLNLLLIMKWRVYECGDVALRFKLWMNPLIELLHPGKLQMKMNEWCLSEFVITNCA